MNYKLRKVHDFFRYDIKQGIRNLVRWFPAVWKDRDWDHIFLYDIMRSKLKMMEKFQFNHGICISHKEISHKIKVCRILLDRLSKDEYLDNALIPHEKRWGELSLDFEDVPGKNYCKMQSNWSLAKTKDQNEKASKEFSRAGTHAEKMTQQDLDMLFRNMRKYILEWWD